MSHSLPAELSLNYLPRLPRRKDWRIGCVGAGFIVRDCHLVAYQQAGFNPIAIASRTYTTAQEVAALRNVPIVHETVDALLADSDIEVLDVAVPPLAQPDLIRRAVELGRGRLRGILAQKPLALTVAEAKELVDLCDQAGIVLAVNQNMRYDQSIRAAKDLLSRGTLGKPVFASIDMRAVPHWMPWAEGMPSLSTFVMSIHHLDTFRYWLGTPDRVLASTRPDPRTKFPHRDGINLYILEYDAGPRAAAWDDVWAGPTEVRGGESGEHRGGEEEKGRRGEENLSGVSVSSSPLLPLSSSATRSDLPSRAINWRLEGTAGLARGTIGWPKYPAREPSTLEYSTVNMNGWVRPTWQEVWFPDAFVGTMAQLLCAIEDNTEPEIGGRDNVETIALCAAVFAAATEHRVTTVAEFLR